MSRVLVIGCGGVAQVAIQKIAMVSEVFEEMMIASRTISKCDAVKAKIEATNSKTKVTTATVDADNVEELTARSRTMRRISFSMLLFLTRI